VIQNSDSEEWQQLLLQADRLGPGPLVPQLPGPQDHRIDVTFVLPAELEQAAALGRSPAVVARSAGIEGIHGLTRVGPKLGTPAVMPIGQNTQ